MIQRLSIVPLLLALSSCGGQVAPATKEAQAIASVKGYVQTSLEDLRVASVALQAAAPEHAWNATGDAAAIATMKTQWKKARISYEQVEGAIAVLFPDLDVSTDERYDGFLSTAADADLFDDQGVTGIHAVERILYSDAIPASVVAFEQPLVGYKVAAFPASTAEATAFKTRLCARQIADVEKMLRLFKPLALDSATAFRGVIGSMGEQIEKLEKGATGEEESRYAQFTLADMRTNVAAGKAILERFKPWLVENKGQKNIDAIAGAFARVDAAYAQVTGDALPTVPSTWSSQHPSDADLQTVFGKLYSALKHEADAKLDGTLVSEMNKAADVLAIPQLAQ